MPRPDFSARAFDILRVLEVHDGDTMRLLLDGGFETSHFPWLRLKDFSCPELRVKDLSTGKMVDNPAGVRARMMTMALLHNYIATAWVVTYRVSLDAAAKLAEEYGDTRRTLTRYLAEVWLDADVSLGGELVKQGLAKPGAMVG